MSDSSHTENGSDVKDPPKPLDDPATLPMRTVNLRGPFHEGVPAAPRAGESVGPSRPDASQAADITVRGRYLLFGEIAHGGMGAVLLGRDPELGRDLAIKVLLERHQNNPEDVRRFIEEARIGGQLQHPGIVPVYELGRFPAEGPGPARPYFTMKLVQGRTLAVLLDERSDPSQDLPRFLLIFEQVCQTLAYAHSKGVIHRDLKPANVMVGTFGEVQVMDWGLAKVLDEGAPNEGPIAPSARIGSEPCLALDSNRAESKAGSVLGTPAYMPPEQANGDPAAIDRRADVFGLGALLCEVLTGKPPYTGVDGAAIHQQAVRADLTEALQRLDSCGADADLVQLARNCLASQVADRPRDASAVADRVTTYRASVQERLRTAEIERAAAQARAAEESKRRRLAVALTCAVVLLALLGAGGTWGLAHSRAIHQERTQRAYHEADTLRARAQAAPPGEASLAKWDEALIAARYAEDLLAQGLISSGMEGPVRQLRATLESEAATAHQQVEAGERDRRLVERLADIRTQKEDEFDSDETEANYARAFKNYGVDIVALPVEEAAAQLRTRPSLAADLAAALDDWSWERWRRVRPRDEIQQLTKLACALDEDPWRNRLRTLGNEPAAIRELADKARISELPPASIQLLGRMLLSCNERARALTVLREGQRRHPQDVWLNYELAQLLATLPAPGRDEAIGYFLAARALRPEIGHALAHVLAQRGQLDEARALFEELVRLRPNNPRHRNCLAGVLTKQRRWREAEAQYVKALELDRTMSQVHNNLGLVLVELKRLPEAESAYQKALELTPKYPEAHINLANLLVDQSRFAEAEPHYRLVMQMKPKEVRSYINLGILLRRQNRLPEAEKVYLDAIAADPSFGRIYFNYSHLLMTQNRYPEAIAALRKAVELDPSYPESHCNLGQLLQLRGDYIEALPHVRRGHELGSKLPGWKYNSAQWLRNAEELAEVERSLRKIQRNEAQPRNGKESLQLAKLCDRKRLYAVGARMYAAAFSMQPNLVEDPMSGHRFRAAVLATLAASGQGEDGGKLADPERAGLRKQAHEWLTADRGLWDKLAEKGEPRTVEHVWVRMGVWQRDPSLVSLRNPDGVNKLPAEEQPMWKQFWAEVIALEKRLLTRLPKR
jgi:serine/threonine-protein kinase